MQRDLIPPPELIVSSGIGAEDTRDLEAEYERIGKGIFNSLKSLAGLTRSPTCLRAAAGWHASRGQWLGSSPRARTLDSTSAESRFSGASDTRSSPSSASSTPTFSTPALINVVDNYLGEIARVLKPSARTWNSFLLLDEMSEPKVIEQRNDGRRMLHPVDGGRIANTACPEQVVGLYLDRVEELHEKHGLVIEHRGLANWSGGRPRDQLRRPGRAGRVSAVTVSVTGSASCGLPCAGTRGAAARSRMSGSRTRTRRSRVSCWVGRTATE